MDTFKARKARAKKFSSRQIELIIGSLLGDAYLVKTTRGYAFRVNHGLQQKKYVDWKYKILKNFTNSSPRMSSNCYYFRTVSHPFLSFLRKLFYLEGKKRVSRSILKKYLTPLSFSVWVMDDGSKDGNQLRLNTQCFLLEDQKILQKFLTTKLGIETTLNLDKNQYRLRIKEKSMDKVRFLLKKFLIPSMSYKISP